MTEPDLMQEPAPEGYRLNLAALGELEADGEEWSTANIIRLLKSRSCAPGVPWSGQGWGDDHGHTDCWVHGLAARKLEQLQTRIDELEASCD